MEFSCLMWACEWCNSDGGDAAKLRPLAPKWLPAAAAAAAAATAAPCGSRMCGSTELIEEPSAQKGHRYRSTLMPGYSYSPPTAITFIFVNISSMSVCLSVLVWSWFGIG